MVDRIQEKKIQRWIGKGIAIIIIGPRQVGKTTLAKRSVTEIIHRDNFENFAGLEI